MLVQRLVTAGRSTRICGSRRRGSRLWAPGSGGSDGAPVLNMQLNVRTTSLALSNMVKELGFGFRAQSRLGLQIPSGEI